MWSTALLLIFPVSSNSFNNFPALQELLPNGTENTAEQLETVRKILTELRAPKPTTVQNRGKVVPAPPNITQSLNGTVDELASANKKLEEYLFEGDILLNVHQARAIADTNGNKKKSRPKRQYTPFQSLWNKTKPIYYTIQGMNSNVAAMVRAAAQFWTRKTCLNFVEHPWASPRLRFLPLTGCWSSIGRQTGWNSQDISIGTGCQSMGNAAHEIAHALGFYHTQSRPDRDYYVTLNRENIPNNKMKNFVRVYDQLGTSRHVGYDFGSVMHYGSYAFAKNSRVPTVMARDWRFQSTMGRREQPSFGDVKSVNVAYGCAEACGSSLPCENNGFVNSRNCNKCLCPLQFTGDLCQFMSRGSAPVCNAQVLMASAEWATFRGEFTSSGNGQLDDCHWIIKAPQGRRIQLILNPLQTTYCDVTCSSQAVEINTGNFELGGMRFCCGKGASFTSDDSLLAIRGEARKGGVAFDIQFSLL